MRRLFNVGELVTWIPDRFLRRAAPGDYRIIAAMPDRDGEHMYRIKSPLEEYERVFSSNPTATCPKTAKAFASESNHNTHVAAHAGLQPQELVHSPSRSWRLLSLRTASPWRALTVRQAFMWVVSASSRRTTS